MKLKLRLVLVLSLVLVYLSSSVGKLCCEPQCNVPISYGRTIQRHITKDGSFLSYPQSAMVSVLAKGAHFGENGEEFWEAEIRGQRGLIHSTAVNEITYKCEPKEFHTKSEEEEKEEMANEDGQPETDNGHAPSFPGEESTNQPTSADQTPPISEQEKDEQRSFETDNQDFSNVGQDLDGGAAQPRDKEGGNKWRDESSDKPTEESATVQGGEKRSDDADSDNKMQVEQPRGEEEEGGRDNLGHVKEEEEHYISSLSQDDVIKVHPDKTESQRQQPVMTTPPIGTPPPPPEATVREEMLATLTPHSPRDDKENVGRNGHASFAPDGRDQLPPMQGNLPPHSSDNDESHSDTTATTDQSSHVNVESQPYQEEVGGNLKPEETVDHRRESVLDFEKARDSFNDENQESHFDLPAEHKDGKPQSGNANSVPEDSYQTDKEEEYDEEGDKMEEDGYYDDDDEDDDRYWEDVEEPEFTTKETEGVREPPAASERETERQLPHEDQQQERSEEEEEREREKKDEHPPTIETQTPPSEAPPTEAPPSEAPPLFISPTEAPPSDTPPSDGKDHQPNEAAPELNKLDIGSLGLRSTPQPSKVDEASTPTDQVVDVHSSQLPHKELEKPVIPDRQNTVIDGTYLPEDDEDYDPIPTTTLESNQYTPTIVSTPILDSGSRDHDTHHDSQARETPTIRFRSLDTESEQAVKQNPTQDQSSNPDSNDQKLPSVDGSKTEYEEEREGNAYQHQDQQNPNQDGGDQQEPPKQLSLDEIEAATKKALEELESPQDQLIPDKAAEDTPTQEPAVTDQSEPEIIDYRFRETGSDERQERGTEEDTPPTPPTTDDYESDSLFEEPPPPPQRRYSCRDDYLAMPGYASGGWMAYHEQVRNRVRDFVLDSLPEEWSQWVCHNRPMMAVVFTSVICISLFAPLVMIWCLSGRSGKQKIKQIQLKLSNYRKLEEDLSKAQNDKSVLERKLRESDDHRQELEDKLALLKQDFDSTAREKGEIEAHYHSVTGALTTAQQEITQYLANTEQLNSQITNLQSQVAAVVNEREGALQQATHLSTTIQDLEQKVQALEAQKDQLEQDRFTAQTALQDLQAQHDEVTAKLQESAEECEQLSGNLNSTTAELEDKMASLSEKEEELQTLRSCLSQVTEEAAVAGNEGTDGGAPPQEGEAETGEEGGTVDSNKIMKQSQLDKIQAMLNTTKVQLELCETVEERDRLLAQLRETTTKLEQQTADNEQLTASYSALESKEQETAFQLKELELKMKGVKEYFLEKERELHKRIEVGEVSRMRYEQLESEAQEKASAADHERQRERQELTELRDQITDIEKSYSNQIKNTEMRAGDAIASLRRTEQELRQANKEITFLRRRLSELDNAPPSHSMMRPIPARGPGYPPLSRTRPPSTGPPPPPHDGSLQPPRPISAPRLEPRRTSSPSAPETLGPLPSIPSTSRVPPGGFHKSQSSGAMVNTSLPLLGTPGSRTESSNRPGSRNELSFQGQSSTASSSQTNLPASSQPQGTGEQRAGGGLPQSRQAPPLQPHPPSTGRAPLKTPPVPMGGAPPPSAPGRPMPPRGYGYPPQPYPGGRMYRGPPPPVSSSRPPYPPPHQQYPPGPRQPMAPPSDRSYRGAPPPSSSGAPPPQSRIRTPGPPGSGYPSGPGQPQSSWQQGQYRQQPPASGNPPPPHAAAPRQTENDLSGEKNKFDMPIV